MFCTFEGGGKKKENKGFWKPLPRNGLANLGLVDNEEPDLYLPGLILLLFNVLPYSFTDAAQECGKSLNAFELCEFVLNVFFSFFFLEF